MFLPRYYQKKEYESNLSEARIQAGLTIKELCEKAKVHITDYSELNSGVKSPISKTGIISQPAYRLADTLSMELSDLWPLYFCDISRYHELSVDEVVDNFHHGMLSFEFQDPELKLFEREKLDMLNKIMYLSLGKRRFNIMKMRYVDEMTYVEIGKHYNISSNTVRDIDRNTLSRIRHSRQFKLFTELYCTL